MTVLLTGVNVYFIRLLLAKLSKKELLGVKRTSKGPRCLQLIFYWLKPPLIVTFD